MPNGHRRPSLLGALLWIGIGTLFLLHNFGVIADMWYVVSRYWPVLLIILGIGKILEHYFKKEAVGIRVGEIVGILLLVLIGTAVTRIAGNVRFGRFVRTFTIPIGGTPVRPGQFIGISHAYSEQVTYPLQSPVPIRIENSYGRVSVRPGSDGQVRVVLRKVVFAGDEARAKSFAEEIHLVGSMENPEGTVSKPMAEAEPGKKPGVFVVRTNRDELSSREIEFNTDMEVFVPRNSQLRVLNSRGQVSASGLNGKLDLSTDHMNLDLQDCKGEFIVSNRYADSRLLNLEGNLTVDARGKVYIEKVKGDVDVRNEYSPTEIFDVDGKLTVTATEKELRVERVTGPVVLKARGNNVRVADLRDRLEVETSHGRVDVSGIASQVTARSRFASLVLKDVQGDVAIESSSDRISADEIGGRFVVKARSSGIRVNEVGGPLDISTTLKDVAVANFAGSCTIRNEFASIRLFTGRMGKGNVYVRNRNGDVNLILPRDAAFSIQAYARNGKIESGYEGLEPTRKANVSSLDSKVSSGGPKINLETEYGDIRIQPAGGEVLRRTREQIQEARTAAAIAQAQRRMEPAQERAQRRFALAQRQLAEAEK